MSDWQVIAGDCLEVLPTLDAVCVDSIVTDPPYGLSFMGKDWDHGIPGERFWRDALRVAKPGAHLLAFGGTRTFHRLTCAIEDAGWEIRDCVMWVYGSGFPKSLDVGKAIDKAKGAKREVVGLSHHSANRTGSNGSATFVGANGEPQRLLTAPATPEASQWQGWGTALKPAWEPIIVARKPLAGTVEANVRSHGTGALNVDGCRVGTNGECTQRTNHSPRFDGTHYANGQVYAPAGGSWQSGGSPLGRWPANLIHDGSGEVVGLFPDNVKGQVGMRKVAGGHRFITGDTTSVQKFDHGTTDTGSAARFFYCAKASKADRGEGNTHPTVKPTALMRYLCRLVTPPGGLVLDPFCGSGSTGRAAALEGFRFVGVEQHEPYAEIARRRIADAVPLQEAV